MANNTARELAEELYLKGCCDGLNPIIKDRQAQCSKVVDKFYHSLCDLIIEGMGKDWEYTDSKSGCGCGICTQIAIHNSSLSSCKESVRKAMGEEK